MIQRPFIHPAVVLIASCLIALTARSRAANGPVVDALTSKGARFYTPSNPVGPAAQTKGLEKAVSRP